jgi:hypothetical protein
MTCLQSHTLSTGQLCRIAFALPSVFSQEEMTYQISITINRIANCKGTSEEICLS